MLALLEKMPDFFTMPENAASWVGVLKLVFFVFCIVFLWKLFRSESLDKHSRKGPSKRTYRVQVLVGIVRGKVKVIHSRRTGEDKAAIINQHFIDSLPSGIAIIAIANLNLSRDGPTLRLGRTLAGSQGEAIGESLVPILD